jgi:hypothetical protein
MTVAGLPLVVCVSEAHGAAIELDSSHPIRSSTQNSKQHDVLFSSAKQSAKSPDCKDFRLARGTLLAQGRFEKASNLTAAAHGKSPVALAYGVKAPLYVGAVSRIVRRATPTLRSALSDRRTIVLQI